jgi:predicted nucleotidyltransferase component of viral defense system
MPANPYKAQVQLLVRVLPLVAAEDCFALKGGTAINLFIRDMPRLSVDIDLAYLPVAGRAGSLAAIEAALVRIKAAIEAGIPGSIVTTATTAPENRIVKLMVSIPGAQIKIEANPVMRGSVYPAVELSVSDSVEDEFGFAAIQVLSFADLYGGKLVAAMDRQHPRDLFDARDLFRIEGVDDDLRRAFLVHLISHKRPAAEILACRRKAIADEYENNFKGMTTDEVSLAELEAVRDTLVDILVRGMPEAHRKLLLSIETGAPDWTLLPIEGVPTLPAVLWRLQNIAGLTDAQRADNAAKLQDVFDRAGEGKA